MYRHCVFCAADLGQNEVVEPFPVGRRLAYDQAKGRLWVVCRNCERWNLSPLEERWEAIETCEREYRETRLRASTENIGLARLSEGLELVRIGRPRRPEFAAWRYGDQFGRRRRRNLLLGGGGLALSAAYASGYLTGLITGGAAILLVNAYSAAEHYRFAERTAVRVHDPEGGRIELSELHIQHAELHVTGTGDWDWALVLSHRPPGWKRSSAWTWLRRAIVPQSMLKVARTAPRAEFRGDAAVRAVRKVIPGVNTIAGSKRQVRRAVRLLDETGGVAATFARAANVKRRRLMNPAGAASLAALPAPVRLALEMASHEESERRALEGELKHLERDWREAEEVAAIVDEITLPSRIREALRGIERRERPRDG
ncbi:MAG: hypothetical protein ACODAE_04635 [Gemmatimonadota bacterium]